tara:strand:- start:269 stop:736 length:468 start_codon:yes stop_codon:yes gene_type:complete
MRKVILLGVLFGSVFISCKKEKKETTTVAEKTVVETPSFHECYSAVIKKDTVYMTLNIKGDQLVSGKLSYIFYEKDKNFGTLVGEIKNDTLYADYSFMSEGIASVRQVVFLKKGNNYVEGYGAVIDDNKGKVIFKDVKQLNFDGSMILSKVDCKM